MASAATLCGSRVTEIANAFAGFTRTGRGSKEGANPLVRAFFFPLAGDIYAFASAVFPSLSAIIS